MRLVVTCRSAWSVSSARLGYSDTWLRTCWWQGHKGFADHDEYPSCYSTCTYVLWIVQKDRNLCAKLSPAPNYNQEVSTVQTEFSSVESVSIHAASCDQASQWGDTVGRLLPKVRCGRKRFVQSMWFGVGTPERFVFGCWCWKNLRNAWEVSLWLFVLKEPNSCNTRNSVCQ